MYTGAEDAKARKSLKIPNMGISALPTLHTYRISGYEFLQATRQPKKAEHQYFRHTSTKKLTSKITDKNDARDGSNGINYVQKRKSMVQKKVGGSLKIELAAHFVQIQSCFFSHINNDRVT